MSILLNHTIVRCSDKHAAAAFFARLLGHEVGAPAGPFVPVAVNADLTFDFDDRRGASAGHFGFLVDDDTFDAVLGRVRADPEVPFGSAPMSGWDRRTNSLGGGRGVYVGDPDGNSYELFTVVPPV
ncbi:VOC family protein [Pseudonocardia sp. TRM90224]|uniref:VOC family protein n=1 Tax=Pseudonocardia sp. TRM90224 TaxID=2812678 RepID=UPI001E354872|nr:VOC family protein [Pseudonocardia sp. TRM90224]